MQGRWSWWWMIETVEGPTPGSCLNMREVVVVAQAVKTMKKTTSGLHLDAREVVVVADGRNSRKNHLWLAFECEGGGGGRSVESTKKTHLRLVFGCEGGGGDGRRVKRMKKNHLRLMFGCKGGGCGGSLGVADINGRRRKREWRKWAMTNVVACFHDALLGPPTSWVPPHVSPTPTPAFTD